MNKVALVTGAAGFIGSHLCEKLIKENFTVIGIDNFFRGRPENLPESGKNFYFYNLDLTEGQSLQDTSNIINHHRVTHVFHYAAINGTKYFYDIPNKVFSDNIRMTINVLNACQQSLVKNFIYASSSEIYGDNPGIPTSESSKIILNIDEDRDSYASSKAFGEFLVKNFCESSEIDYLNLRIFNTYGTRMDNSEYGQVVPEFIRKALKDDVFTIIGSGNQTRSFCNVRDHVDMVFSAVGNLKCQSINIGNDEEITINQLAKTVHDIVKRDFNPKYTEPRSYDTKRRCPSLDKIKNIVDIDYTSLEFGISEIIEEYRKYKY